MSPRPEATGSTWWLTLINGASVSTVALFLLLWVLGALPFLPFPIWTQLGNAIAAHDRNTQEGIRVQRVICSLLAKDDAASRRECWRSEQ